MSNNIDGLPGIVYNLSPDDEARAKELAKQINIEDSSTIVQFGVQPQQEISRFSDQVLDHIRAKDGGFAGQIITELMLKIKDVDVESLSSSQSFAAKIPLIGGLFDRAKRVLAQYQKVGSQIEQITSRLDEARMQLMKDNTILDAFYKKNVEHFQQLTVYIAAGNLKAQELETKVVPELQAQVAISNDPAEVQRLNDVLQFTQRFEKKIHDLTLSRTIAIQTAPQLRLIQNNNQMLVEKIQSSILNTIPLWKNQIVIAISLFRQKKALELQREVSKATNDLLLKNSELLKTNNTEIVQENEKGIVEIDTLKKVHANLISTLEDTLRIQEEGRSKRKAAESEIAKMELELKNKISEIAQR